MVDVQLFVDFLVDVIFLKIKLAFELRDNQLKRLLKQKTRKIAKKTNDSSIFFTFVVCIHRFMTSIIYISANLL